jgi:hypothetical protein
MAIFKTGVTLVTCAALALLALIPSTVADNWAYPAKRTNKVFTFGETRIVLITDGTKNRKSPDFIFRIYENGHLRSQVHNIWFEQVFPSPDRRLFVGLSNRGIPGTAVVIFDRHGAISLLASHGIAQFHYCDESVTLVRCWYDEKNPDVKFPPTTGSTGTSGITLRDCLGQTVDLGDVVLKAYNTTFERTQRNKTAPSP